MPNKAQSEAEVKFELKNSQEIARIITLLNKIGYIPKTKDTLQEYYTSIESSPLGGWNFERFRSINGTKFLHTTKKWSLDGQGNRIRLEDEHLITKEEFQAATTASNVPHFTKEREDFLGTIEGEKATVSIDTLTKNDIKRYFFECEVIVAQDKAYEARQKLTQWVATNLGIATQNEAPSMIDIVFGTSEI